MFLSYKCFSTAMDIDVSCMCFRNTETSSVFRASNPTFYLSHFQWLFSVLNLPWGWGLRYREWMLQRSQPSIPFTFSQQPHSHSKFLFYPRCLISSSILIKIDYIYRYKTWSSIACVRKGREPPSILCSLQIPAVLGRMSWQWVSEHIPKVFLFFSQEAYSMYM